MPREERPFEPIPLHSKQDSDVWNIVKDPAHESGATYMSTFWRTLDVTGVTYLTRNIYMETPAGEDKKAWDFLRTLFHGTMARAKRRR